MIRKFKSDGFFWRILYKPLVPFQQPLDTSCPCPSGIYGPMPPPSQTTSL